MGKTLLNNVSTFDADNLINSSTPAALTYSVTIRAGEGKLKRGTVLARSSDEDYVVLGTVAGGGETLTANCILADDVDVSGSATSAIAYRTGHMNRNVLTVKSGYTMTVEDEEELRRSGILLSDAQTA